MRQVAVCILIAALLGSAPRYAPGQTAGQTAGETAGPSSGISAPSSPDDFRRAGVAAATDRAVQGLLDQIDGAPVAGRLTVGQFLFQTNSADEFRATLSRSDPIGGPRWLDDQTCQVRLEVSGTEVVADLANIAVRHAAHSPIAARDLPAVATQLSSLWFAATGTSTAAGVTPLPPPGSPWSDVPPAVRRHAVADADADAVRSVLLSLEPIPLTPGHPLGEALGDPSVRRSVTDWLAARPVTAVEYLQSDRGQLQVRVTLAARPDALFDVLRAAITAANDISRPLDPTGWDLVRGEVLRRIGPAVGQAAPPPLAATLPVVITSRPPDWAGGMLDVSGQGGPSATYLRAARMAEADAMSHLRTRVMALHLTTDQTIGHATEADPRLGRAVDRAIARAARLYKSQYNPDGTVDVRVSLDLRVLWAAIVNQP